MSSSNTKEFCVSYKVGNEKAGQIIDGKILIEKNSDDMETLEILVVTKK